MRIKRFTLTAVVVLMILTFTVTAVGAQADPPVVVDPGTGEAQTTPDRSGFTIQPDDWVPPEEPISINAATIPISPAYTYVFTRTPKFIFYRNYQATQYEIEVYSLADTATVYYYSDAGTCTSYYCSLKPSTKLKFRDYWDVDSGFYYWRVRAYVGGWQAWSPYVEFGVISKGFNDTFLTNTLGGRWWNIVHSSFSWVKTDTKSQLKAPGELSWWSTVVATDNFFNIDYTVRMKRKLNDSNSNAVIIWADLWPTSSTNELDDGVYFQYTNNSYWGIWKKDSGTFSWISGWNYNPTVINEYGWNELRIVGNYPYVDVWLNGNYLGWFAMSGGPSGGFTGVSMFYDNDPGPLLVDWAIATPIQYGVYAEHDPTMQLGLEPVPEGMDPMTAPSPVLDDPTGTR